MKLNKHVKLGSTSVNFKFVSDRILRPGTGFDDLWGTNIIPVGTAGDPGFDAKVIARWDVVPHQTIDTESFNVGVVAFHINEVDRVEIFLEGGEPVVVDQMTLNPRTGVYEYWATIDPDVLRTTDLVDGPIELRAVAYPRGAGEPRVLPSLTLNSNVNGTLPELILWCAPEGDDTTGDGSEGNPFRQPYRAMQFAGQLIGGPAGADGCRVLLSPGEYYWGGTNWAPRTLDRWATIEAGPGVAPEEVVIRAGTSNGFRTKLLCARNITFERQLGTAIVEGGMLWLDGCVFRGDGPHEGQRPFTHSVWPGGVWVTGCRLTQMRDGFFYSRLVRNSKVENIGQVAYGGSKLVLNCEADLIHRGATDYHPDVYILRGHVENIIVFGLTATRISAQGLFGDDLGASAEDVAFVNIVISRPLGENPVGPPYSQWACPSSHLLFWHVSLPDTTFLWSSPSMENISVRSCVMHRSLTYDLPTIEEPVVFDWSWFVDCHIIDAGTVGSYVPGLGLGDPGFSDASSGDFRPAANSPLRGQVAVPIRSSDIEGAAIVGADSIGAYK